MTHAAGAITVRTEPRPADSGAVRDIVASSGFFRPDEVDVAVELIDDRLARAGASDYRFVFLDDESGRTVGYACFGAIACTIGSFDLYWIAVRDEQRGRGLGRLLLEAAEREIARLGGRRVYIETSSRPLYEPTRGFYGRCGYRLEATLPDFYTPGDGKLIYAKAL